MSDYTTIQITTAQKEQLDDLKRIDGESYKSVVALLIAHYNNRPDGPTRGYSDVDESELAAALADDLVAQLPKPLAEELVEELQ